MSEPFSGQHDQILEDLARAAAEEQGDVLMRKTALLADHGLECHRAVIEMAFQGVLYVYAGMLGVLAGDPDPAVPMERLKFLLQREIDDHDGTLSELRVEMKRKTLQC